MSTASPVSSWIRFAKVEIYSSHHSRLSSSAFPSATRAARNLTATSLNLGTITRCSLEVDRFPPEDATGIDDEDDATTSNPELGALVKHRVSSEIKAFVTGDGNFMPLSRRPRFRLRAKSFQSRPLWKRIFFASKKVRSIMLLNVLTVIYASDIPVLKEVEAIMEPAFFNMIRFCVSAIPFLPFVFYAREDRHVRASGIELGFWVSLGCLCQALGLITSDAGRASFISAFTVIIVPLINGILGEAVPALTWSGALVSLIGVAFLECTGSPPCVGDILNILSAIFFGIHMLRTERISRTTKKEKLMALLGYEVCVVAMSSVIWFLLKDFGGMPDLNLGSCSWSMVWNWMGSFPWIPALYTGVFSTGLCLWAEMNAMNDVSAAETAIVYGLEPVWGAAFAWFLLGERWGYTEWFGAALVLCGSLTVQIISSMPENSKDEESSVDIPFSNSEKHEHFSFSAILVNPRKNLSELYSKQDKLK